MKKKALKPGVSALEAAYPAVKKVSLLLVTISELLIQQCPDYCTPNDFVRSRGACLTRRA